MNAECFLESIIASQTSSGVTDCMSTFCRIVPVLRAIRPGCRAPSRKACSTTTIQRVTGASSSQVREIPRFRQRQPLISRENSARKTGEIALESEDSDLEINELPEESVGEEPWDVPELDSEDERVISMYDGIRKILSGQRETADPRTGTGQGKPRVKKGVSIPRGTSRTLQCGRILKVDVEPNLVVITVEKMNGERRQLRIEARLE